MLMKSKEAKEKYIEAGKLYRSGDIQEALDTLDMLDHAFPNSDGIMYSRAMCLSLLGRYYEARLLANRLDKEFDDARSAKLKKRITKRERRSKLTSTSPDDIEINDDWFI